MYSIAAIALDAGGGFATTLFALVAGGAACFERVQRRLSARAVSGWQALGLGAAVLGAVGVVDYYASAFLVRKYPLKK